MHRLLVGLLMVGCASGSPGDGAVTDAEIRMMIVEDSIRSSNRLCPCPFSTDRSGNLCGDRSEYRSGGRKRLCYASDVSDEMVDRFRRRNR